MPKYVNRWGRDYYLPEFGPPVRWLLDIPQFDDPDMPVLLYYECGADNWAMRAIHIWASGMAMLVYPGGLDGDNLPESALPSAEECKRDVHENIREISELEFNALWAIISRAPSRAVDRQDFIGSRRETPEA